jgi:hypothetical protein
MLIASAPVEMSPAELTAEYGQKILDAVYKELELPIESARYAQLARAKKNALYMDGKQYLAPKWDAGFKGFDWKSVDGEGGGKKRKFASTYNIIYADGMKFVAVVGQRPPNLKVVPEDPMFADHIRRAADAQVASLYLHKFWNITNRMTEVAYYLWSTSAVFFNTEYIADEMKHGSVEVPQYGSRREIVRQAGSMCRSCGAVSAATECPGCGSLMDPLTFEDEISIDVPEIIGTSRFPRGEVELRIKTCFEVGHPIGARTIEECDWISDDVLEPLWKINSMLSEDVGADNGIGSAAIREALDAKDATESPTGVSYRDESGNVLYSRKFLRPSVYGAFPVEMRRQLKANFPEGLVITAIAGKPVSIEARSIDGSWAVSKTGTGPLISSPPLCHQIIPIQDDTNDFINMAREIVLRHIPKTFVDAALIDKQALTENETITGEVVRVKLGTNQSLGNLMGTLPTARFNDQMLGLGSLQREMSREIGGVQPAIFGGGQPSTTFRGENQRKNQALLQLQPAFKEMQEGVRVATRNGIRLMAKFGVGEIRVPSNDPMVPTKSVHMERLEPDGWEVESMESAPVTLAEKQDRVAALSQENPAMAAALGFSHPLNVGELQAMWGVDGMYNPAELKMKYALGEIQALLGETPIVDLDPLTGAEIPTPSRTPDPYMYKDAAFMSEVFRTWAISEAGQTASMESPDGFENVKLFGSLLDQMALPPVPPPGEEGEANAEPSSPPPQEPMPEAPMPPVQ